MLRINWTFLIAAFAVPFVLTALGGTVVQKNPTLPTHPARPANEGLDASQRSPPKNPDDDPMILWRKPVRAYRKKRLCRTRAFRQRCGETGLAPWTA